MFVFVFAYPKFHTTQIMGAFFGFFYVAVMLSYVYHIRMLAHGVYLAFLIFLCSWGCDTCAYCVGKLFGKHKMTPKLSPKKSIEGAVGGVVGAALLTALYCFIFRTPMELDTAGILTISVIAAIAALISMVGDLTASAIKRNYDIKDYGHLIPGHGGILDRFDSMIITAPIIYYLAVMVM
jgi:phosphatidate cytidylyltransferase